MVASSSNSKLDTLGRKIDRYTEEVSRFVSYSRRESLHEEIFQSLKLRNVTHARQLAREVEKNLKKNLEGIKNFSPKKEPPIARSLFITLMSILVLFISAFLVSVSHGDVRTDIVRWIDNFAFLGACFVPPIIFLAFVIFPRMDNDVRIHEFEIKLVNDLERMIVIKAYIESKSARHK